MHFDNFYYKHKYSDLFNIQTTLYKHFINNGIKELREPFDLDSVDVYEYIKNNKLKNEIDIKKHIIQNFDKNIIITYKENILSIKYIFSKENSILFNWKEYILLNNDLNYIKIEYYAINHFINYGFKEKRLFCKPKIGYDSNEIWKKYIYFELFKIDTLFDWEYYIKNWRNGGYGKNIIKIGSKVIYP